MVLHSTQRHWADLNWCCYKIGTVKLFLEFATPYRVEHVQMSQDILRLLITDIRGHSNGFWMASGSESSNGFVVKNMRKCEVSFFFFVLMSRDSQNGMQKPNLTEFGKAFIFLSLSCCASRHYTLNWPFEILFSIFVNWYWRWVVRWPLTGVVNVCRPLNFL